MFINHDEPIRTHVAIYGMLFLIHGAREMSSDESDEKQDSGKDNQ